MAKFRNRGGPIEAAMFPGTIAVDGSSEPHPDFAAFQAWIDEHKGETTVVAAKEDLLAIAAPGGQDDQAITGDWIVALGGGKLDVIDAAIFAERYEPVSDIDPPDPDELTFDAAGETLTPLEDPLDIGDIDIVSFAAVTAHMAAGQLYGLLTTEEGGMVPDWMGSRGGDIEADVNAFAGFLHAEKVDTAETLWLQAVGEGWIAREAAGFAEIAFPRRQAFLVFAQVAGKVLAALGQVQLQLEHEQALARSAEAQPPLAREDSIDPAPERMDALIEGFEPKPKRGGFKDPSKFDHDGDGRPGGSKPKKPRTLSIGQTPVAPPVNRGGRGRTKSDRDRRADAAKTAE